MRGAQAEGNTSLVYGIIRRKALFEALTRTEGSEREVLSGWRVRVDSAPNTFQ